MNFYKTIAFCSNPVPGHFRFKDVFQIYPFESATAPKSDMVRSHPFVLEICINDTGQFELDGELKEVSNIVANLTAQVNFQNRILKLLTAFSNYRFFIPPITPQWFVRAEGLSEQEMNNQSSVAGLNLFYYPGIKEGGMIKAFTEINLQEIPAQKHPDCFQHIDLGGREPIGFSQLLPAALHNYFLLSEEQQASVDSSIELINQGVELLSTMKSLSFVAFISSIETMVSLEYKDMKIEKCKTCNQDQYKVMAKFRDFLFEYVSKNPDEKKTINNLYNLRSKIAHSGMLLYGDGKIDWSNPVQDESHLNMRLQSMMISKLGLINWILRRGEKEAGKQ